MPDNTNKELEFKKFDEYRALINAARPDFYRVNAFRVLGLCKICFGADEKLFFSGGTEKNVMLPLVDPPPSPEDAARANERLSDPNLRFIDEFFWFIVDRRKKLASLDTLRLLVNSEYQDAAVSWCDEEYRMQSPVMRHNIAIFCHALALDHELAHLKGGLPEEEAESAKCLWTLAFKYWKMLVDDDEFWDNRSSILYEIADKHLTSDIFRQLRYALPYFILTINARLALFSSQTGTPGNVRRQIEIMKAAGFGAGIVDEVLSGVAAPLFAELKGKIDELEREIADPVFASGDIAGEIESATGPLLKTLRRLFDDSQADLRRALILIEDLMRKAGVPVEPSSARPAETFIQSPSSGPEKSGKVEALPYDEKVESAAVEFTSESFGRAIKEFFETSPSLNMGREEIGALENARKEVLSGRFVSAARMLAPHYVAAAAAGNHPQKQAFAKAISFCSGMIARIIVEKNFGAGENIDAGYARTPIRSAWKFARIARSLFDRASLFGLTDEIESLAEYYEVALNENLLSGKIELGISTLPELIDALRSKSDPERRMAWEELENNRPGWEKSPHAKAGLPALISEMGSHGQCDQAVRRIDPEWYAAHYGDTVVVGKYKRYAKIVLAMASLFLAAVFIDVITETYRGKVERTMRYHEFGIIDDREMTSSIEDAVFGEGDATFKFDAFRTIVGYDVDVAGKLIFKACQSTDRTARTPAIRAAADSVKKTGDMVCAALICMTDIDEHVRSYGLRVASSARVKKLNRKEASIARKELLRRLCAANNDVARRAKDTLDFMDPDWRKSDDVVSAIPGLICQIGSSDGNFDRSIIDALATIDPAWRERSELKIAIPRLLSMIKSGSKTSGDVIRALNTIDKDWPKRTGMVESLMQEYYTCGSSEARKRIKPVLIRCGDQAIPVVMKGLIYPDVNIRNDCHNLLREINRMWHKTVQARNCIYDFALELNNPASIFGPQIMNVLAIIGPDAISTEPLIFSNFWNHSAEPEYLWSAVGALNEIDPAWKEKNEGKQIIYKILRVNKDAGSQNKLYVEALRRISPYWNSKDFLDKSISDVMPSMFEYKDFVTSPLEWLENDFPGWRNLPLSRQAFIDEFMKREDLLKIRVYVLERYFKILKSFGLDAFKAEAKVLYVLINHKYYDSRVAAAATLDKISPAWKKSSAAVYDLDIQLNSPDPAVRRDAARLLVLIDPSRESDPAIKALISK